MTRSVSFETKESLEIGRSLDNDSLSRLGFLSRGVAIACLNGDGNSPVERDKLTMFVLTGAKM